MSLGENLQYLRKKDNITQEQLAEQLDVSRQSVSKWESDTTYPEMDKLLQLCRLFHCNIDELVQGNIREINLEGKEEYDKHMNQFSIFIALGTGIIIFGIAVMFLFYGLNYFVGENTEIFKEDLTTLIFFIFLTIGVAILILMGMQHSNYVKKNPVIDFFYTQNEIDAFDRKFSIFIVTGVLLILIGIMLMLGIESIYPEIDSNEYLESLLSCVFMIFITIAVMIFIYASIRKSKYDIKEYNESNDKESDLYKKNNLTSTVCSCIIMIATIVFLIAGLGFGEWGMSAPVCYSVGGIACGIASIIIHHRK